MDEIARLRAEVEVLRARLRVWTWTSALGGAVLAALAGAAVLRAGSSRDRLVVREITIVDDAGVTRGRLGVDALGNAALTLGDGQGQVRTRLEAGDQQAGLRLTSADQRVLVRLSAVLGQSALQLTDSKAPRTAILQAAEDTTSLRLEDHAQSLQATLRADRDGADLQIIRSTDGASTRVAAIGAGSSNADYGPGMVLARPGQFLQASVDRANDEPRVVLGGTTRVESTTRATGPLWARGPRETGQSPPSP